VRVLGAFIVLLLPIAATAKSVKPAATPVAALVDIDALLAGLAKAPGLYARFREVKHITLLKQPLVSEGTIHFAPPARFARKTEKPFQSTLIVDGNRLQFGGAEGHESMNLGTNPVAKLFADSFVMLLSGNRAGLERMFKMQLAPKAGGAWSLVLTPRVAPMDKMIAKLELRGRGLTVDELDVHESSGDWTETSFSDVDLKRNYTAADQARIFTLPGK
jgi:hypothetical protein